MAPSAMLAHAGTKQASTTPSVSRRLKNALSPRTRPGEVDISEAGFLNLSGSLAIVGVIVGAILALLIVAALFPNFMGALGSVNENMTTATTGDATADSLIPVFTLIIALAGLLGIVSIILYAVSFKTPQ